jgi:kanamycin nucleotidyltransferase
MNEQPLSRADETERRVALARVVAERKRAEMGEHLLAVACYGSVAHGAAGPHSDIELLLLTDDTVELTYEPCFVDGVQCQCDILPASRMLRAAPRVTEKWGIEADQHRCHLDLWDPDGYFARVRAAASDLRDDDFEAALRSGWWAAYEIRNKARNGLLANDAPRAIFHGWEFAYACAMRIALRERRPYESDRTIWADVSRRGYDMPALIAALSGGDAQALWRAMDAAWEQVGGWGAPESAPVR